MNAKPLLESLFTRDDQDQIVADFLALSKPQIRDFLAQAGLSKSGTKSEVRDRIERAPATCSLSISRIIRFLDDVIPWGKQHVFLYKGPPASIANWRNREWVAELLRKHGLEGYLNANLPLALPGEMKVSSILHDGRRLRVTAIKRRQGWIRDKMHDASTVSFEGDEIELRAFVRKVARSLVAFEWDLFTNTALMQISQLPTGIRYEDVASEFCDLVSRWLQVGDFTVVDLRPAIKKLHALEETGCPETRSHGINYRTLQGRRLDVRSPSPADSVLGESPIDAALGAVRDVGVGHNGNFYWLPTRADETLVNPLDSEVHVEIVGARNRINFPTPNIESTIRYVLSRIRNHCA